MNLLRSLAMALACFSIVPMPNLDWEKTNMRYMMCFFPMVGVIVGLCLWLWLQLCQTLGFGTSLTAVGFTLVPIVVSGGIHMDGFADVVDAQSSHAEPDRKRQILKDPHTGAFATIGVGCYLLAYFGFACEFDAYYILLLACAPILSRSLSGLATMVFPLSSDTGMLAAERQNSNQIVLVVLGVLTVGVCVALVLLGGAVGLAVVFAALASWGFIYVFSKRQFAGMNGDLAGFFLQVAELAMLVVLVLVSKVV